MDCIPSEVGEMVIKFFYVKNGDIPKKMPLTYPEVLKYDGKFKIIINNEVFFEDDYFLIYEFFMYVNMWINGEKENMFYNCMEIEENPLISFELMENGMWRIISKWQKFESTEVFTKEQIMDEIKRLL